MSMRNVRKSEKSEKNEKSEKKGLQKVLRAYINSITETKCLDERQ